MALYNEKLRTEDIVEVRDGKILSTLAIPALGIVVGDNYHTVTTQVSTRTLTLGEKAALNAVLSTPSASNPVVLKDDVEVYYQQGDFGEILDAVLDLVDLPLTANLGDLCPVINEGAIYRWNGLSWDMFIHTGTLSHVDLIDQNGDASSRHLTSTELNTLNDNDHIHGVHFDPTDVDTLNSKIDITNIYPDDTPVKFSSMGTLPGGLIAGTQYYIVNSTPTSIQVSPTVGGLPVVITSQGSNLTPTGTAEPELTDSHFLSVLPLLEQITSAGSGKIITDSERVRLNSLTPDVIAALLGTVGTPSNINRYVTDFDARVNTLRNPYATVGTGAPPCSYPGANQAALEDGLRGISSFPCTISFASPAVVTADTIYQNGDQVYFFDLSTLPDPITVDTPYYVRNAALTTFNVSLTPLGPLVDTTEPGSGIVGGNNSALNALALLPETYTVTDSLYWDKQPDGWLLEGWTPGGTTLNCVTLGYALNILPDGDKVHLRGLNIVLTSSDGVLLERDRCVLEDCTISGAGTGIRINADYCIVTRCSFKDTASLEILGDFALVSECRFDLTNISDTAIDAAGDYVTIAGCYVTKGTVETSGDYALLRGNTFKSTAVWIDLGTATRFIQNPSYTGDKGGDAYVGARKTIGPLSSGADYRGDTHAVFTAALADPDIREFEVLPGTYTFAAAVVIPAGKRVLGNNAVRILNSTLPAFQLSNDAVLSGLRIERTTGGLPPNAVEILTAVQRASVVDCTINDGGVYLTNAQGCRVERCKFVSAVRGVILDNACTNVVVSGCLVMAGTALSSHASSSGCLFRDNVVQSGTVTLAGTAHIIRGNIFVAGAPSKTGVVGGIWQGNFPMSANQYGSLYEVLDVGRHLRGYTPGCDRVVTADCGALSFVETQIASATTGLVRIPFEVDTAVSYDVALTYTSLATMGNTYWRVIVTFFDGTNQLGTPQVQYLIVPRTGLTVRIPDLGTYSNATYGVSSPTHFSVDVTRLPTHANDTMAYAADLLSVTLTLKRL